MTFIYCKTCGRQISPNAKTCPGCGGPTQPTCKTFLFFAITVPLIAAICFAGYMFFTWDTNSETHQKEAIVKEILGKDCLFISQASSEYIKQPMLAAGVNAIVSNRCDCIQEVIVPKMIQRYTLHDLQEMEVKPIQTMQIVANLIIENAGEIQGKCLSLN